MAQKMVTLKKGKVEHEFVEESVHVWLDRGWSRVDDGNGSKKSDDAAKQQKKES